MHRLFCLARPNSFLSLSSRVPLMIGLHRIFARQIFAYSISVFSICSLITGCSHSPGAQTQSSPTATATHQPAPPHALTVVVDRSESTRPLRPEMFSQMDTVTLTAIADDLPLDVWAYDRSAVKIWGPQIPEHKADLDAIKFSELSPTPAKWRSITRPALVLEALVQDRALHPVPDKDIVLLTDGDAEVATDFPRLITAAKNLGKDPTLRLIVADIKPQDRKMWDGALSLAMPHRYLLLGPSEPQSALARFLQGRA